MTYQEARDSGLQFNRKKYRDGWYYVDHRGIDCSSIDLSQRFWTQEDLEATDWIVKEDPIWDALKIQKHFGV